MASDPGETTGPAPIAATRLSRGREVAIWALAVGGMVGLLSALGFERRRGPDWAEFRMGWPDAWVVWESTPNGGFRWEVDFLRWSILLLIVSVYSVYYAVRLSRRRSADAEPRLGPSKSRVVEEAERP